MLGFRRFGPHENGMRRRAFIVWLGGAASWPLAIRAQQKPVPVIGFLGSSSSGPSTAALFAFQQGLAETGYVIE